MFVCKEMDSEPKPPQMLKQDWGVNLIQRKKSNSASGFVAGQTKAIRREQPTLMAAFSEFCEGCLQIWKTETVVPSKQTSANT